MSTDRRLSANFQLSEVPCWTEASEFEVDQLEEMAARVLQPVRTHFGVPVYVSSWRWWSDGCVPREGSHSAGAVDFWLPDGLTRTAWEWGAEYLIPAGYLGRWIYEPARTAAEGTPQGEHIHAAPRSAMLEVFGDGRIQVLEEKAEGQYVLYYDSSDPSQPWGAPGRPYELPGLVVEAGAPGLFGFALALGLIATLARNPSPATT